MKTYQKPYTVYFEIVGKSIMWDYSAGEDPKNNYTAPLRIPSHKLYL